MAGIKHLVECHCVLALYKNSEKIINHKFPVYSKLDESGNIISKIVKCNNCDAVHLVKELCKSEVLFGNDQTEVILTKEDIGYMLEGKIHNMLTKLDPDISVWEHVLDTIDEELWGTEIVIKRDIVGEKQHVKVLEILGQDRFKLKTEVIKDIIRF